MAKDALTRSDTSDMEEIPMLVLSRKVGQQIVVGDNIIITVVGIFHDKVRIGITAPKDVSLMRRELLDIPLPPSQGDGENGAPGE